MNTDAGAGAGAGAGANPPQNPQNQPGQNREKRGRRRRRRGGQRGGGHQPQQQAGGQQSQQQPKQHGHQHGQQRPHRRDRQPGNDDNRGNRRQGGRQRRGPATFVGPMDHSYRAVNGEANGNANFNGNRSRGVMFHQPSPFDEVEHTQPTVQANGAAPPRIYAFIEELFFFAKIQEISKKLNIKVEFVKSEKEVSQKVEESGAPPSLIIFDLNNGNAKPLVTIPKLRKEFKKGTSILGFVSHVQGDLKVKAQEAGCDVVMPRSAFSQNLVGLLRRHGLPDEEGME